MTDMPAIATLRAELRDDTAFVATPTPRLSWTVESDRAGLGAGIRRTDRRHETVTLDGRDERARRLAVRPARARREPRGHGARALDRRRRDRRGASRCASRPDSSPTASGSRSRSASPIPPARRSRSWCARPSRSTSPSRRATPVLDGARRRRARAQRRRRVRTTCSRPAGRATATGSCTRRSMSPRSCARARTCSARRSPAPGTPRSTASSTSPTASTARSPRSSRSCASTYDDGTTETLAATGDGWQRLRRRTRRRQRHLRRRAPGPLRSRGPRLVGAAASFDDSGRWHRCARARRRGRHARLRERAGARGAHRAAGAPHPDPPRRRRHRRRRPAARSSTSARTSSGACACACAATRGTARRDPARRGARRRRARHPARCATPQATATFDLAGRRRDPREPLLVLRLPLRRDHRGSTIDPADVEAVVLHTDMTRTGWFESSDPLARPPARERRVGHARQLPVDPDRLPAARRAARLDRRHPGLLARRRASSTTATAS